MVRQDTLRTRRMPHLGQEKSGEARGGVPQAPTAVTPRHVGVREEPQALR